jgi:cytidylate kinase
MAIVTISGETGCRWEELARLIALRLNYQLVTEARVADLLTAEFGGPGAVPEKAWSASCLSILARLASEHNLVAAFSGAETLFRNYEGILRIFAVARETVRIGNIMLDSRIDRAAARHALRAAELRERQLRRVRFGRARTPSSLFDMILNTESYESARMVDIVEAGAAARALAEHGLLSRAAESHMQFQIRVQLAKHGIVPAGKAALPRTSFGHPSEEWFANLLDFYHIAWEYEPRSFPLQWDKDGNVIEAFTPDFYLPEANLYVELTTMKQALVTRKNHKIKLLRAIYPHVNIQVFYQKDVQDLIRKYGISEPVTA